MVTVTKEAETSTMSRDERVKNALEQLNFSTRPKAVEWGTWVGKGVMCRGSDVIESFDPSTGECIARVDVTSKGQYEMVIRDVGEAFRQWRMWPAPKRGDVIRELGNAFRKYKQPLAELITIEMGKILPESLGEVEEAIQICDIASSLGWRIGGEPLQSERRKIRAREVYEPAGVFGLITPSNFPLAVWAWNAANAAVCGNTIVWKGSNLTPLVSVAVQKICGEVLQKCKAPAVFNLVTGGADIGTMMAQDENLPLISFTGSTAVGKFLAHIVAGRFGKFLPELGGNNAGIVAEDADMEIAVSEIKRSAFGTTGQRCTKMNRLFAHESIADELCKRLVCACSQIAIGDPLDSGTFMGPLISYAGVTAQHQAFREAHEQGVNVLYNIGTPLNHPLGRNFVSPMIFRMPSQTAVMMQETFAPVLYVATYKTLDQAIAMNNAVEQGLSSSIFTNDFRKAQQFLAESDTGLKYVNLGTSGAEVGWAFGGNKTTGGGREAGSDAWKWYMVRSTCAEFWGTLEELELAQGIKFE